MVNIPWTVVVREGGKTFSWDVTAPMNIPEGATHFCTNSNDWVVPDAEGNTPPESYLLLVVIKGWHSRGSTVFSEGE